MQISKEGELVQMKLSLAEQELDLMEEHKSESDYVNVISKAQISKEGDLVQIKSEQEFDLMEYQMKWV